MASIANLPAAGGLGDEVALTPFGTAPLPVFVQPRVEALRADIGALADWFRTNRPALDQLLVDAGAIVLRGFAVEDTAAFGRVVDCFAPTDFGYLAGASPRAQLAPRVFEATSAPAEAVLGMHQEMAYLPNYPSRIAFYCRMPSVTGGETYLADMRAVTREIPAAFLAAVRERGVLYTRNFRAPQVSTGHPVLDVFHKTWTDAFSTADPGKAIADCAAMGLQGSWLDDGSLSVAYRAPGLIDHPVSGECLWFNQIATQTLNRQNTGDRFALYERHYGSTRPRPYLTTYGDGGAIPEDFVAALYPILSRNTVAFPWSHGDILLIDNFRTAHGRNAFTGLRDVQVALLN
ncbi:TauD/TfdA family dioxygenase [Sphingomonas immobilis]|uniref:TauD/TfdA family dioxygenase n=1 Tax=Sphingomonas immobilis TaxID=3063997 RepID=A0ABT8ZYD6_9SPHN|nr:TauD/TfdA family dioxygenase [Sphingomonas sp. CA1-15]MDO7842298.1 TauD/TfdA family dioxygenase [Sphingomonas sp. CA1-15]